MSALASSVSAVTPLRLSRNEAQARTTIAQRAGGLPVALGAAWRATLRPLSSDEPLAGPVFSARIEWAGAAFVLHLPAAAASQCLESLLEDGSLPELPPALAAAAVEGALAGVLDALQALGRGAPQLVAVETSTEVAAPQLPHAFALALKAEAGPQALDARLYTDALGLLLTAGLVGKRPPAAGPLDEGVPLLLRAEIGQARLALDELESLAAGDAVLLSTCHIGADRGLWLSADGRAGLLATLPPVDAATHALTVTRSWTDTMPASPESESPDAAASLETLPVRLSFDLGDIALTLAELRALQPGQAIELGRPLAGAIRIRANGALVGEGELVSIDGQLGVSVSRLFASTKEQPGG